MFALKKYKIIFYLNFNNSLKYEINTKNARSNNSINYIFKHKNKLFRNFLLIYSIFLTFSQYSNFIYKTNPEFILKLNLIYFLIIDRNVVLF